MLTPSSAYDVGCATHGKCLVKEPVAQFTHLCTASGQHGPDRLPGQLLQSLHGQFYCIFDLDASASKNLTGQPLRDILRNPVENNLHFATYAAGPAAAWSHRHLWVELGQNRFEFPMYAPTGYPAYDAHMPVMLAAAMGISFIPTSGWTRCTR